jgi:hypothetical protein
MASTATAGADKKAIAEPATAVPDDEMPALSTTEIPVTDPVALLHTDTGNVPAAVRVLGSLISCSAAGDAQNVCRCLLEHNLGLCQRG